MAEQFQRVGLMCRVEPLLPDAFLSEAEEHYEKRGALFIAEIRYENRDKYTINLHFLGSSNMEPCRKFYCKCDIAIVYIFFLLVFKHIPIDVAVAKALDIANNVFFHHFKAQIQQPNIPEEEVRKLYVPRQISYLLHMAADHRALDVEAWAELNNFVKFRLESAKAEKMLPGRSRKPLDNVPYSGDVNLPNPFV